MPADPAKRANDQTTFDEYSWKTMIALCWPVDINASRGVPLKPNSAEAFKNANKSDGSPSAPVVWSSYLTAADLFNVGVTPPAWSDKSVKIGRPLKFTNADFDKLPADSDAFDQAFGGPLIDKNGNYTTYNIYFNEAMYSQTRANKWYLKENLPAVPKAGDPPSTDGLRFDLGSIEMKGSWRPMTKSDDQTRYYVRMANLPTSTGVQIVPMGLVGLHIAVKTKFRPQWLWATFEQVDNVGKIGASYNESNSQQPGPENGNEGGYSRKPNTIPAGKAPPYPAHAKPVLVSRVVPILPATAELNARYQKALAGTVWENYELIVNNWPTATSKQALPQPPEVRTFDPNTYKAKMAGDPVPAFVANTTMETYFQQHSCIQCHYHAATNGTDFSWAVFNRAWTLPKK
jgi:hypothetical protein